MIVVELEANDAHQNPGGGSQFQESGEILGHHPGYPWVSQSHRIEHPSTEFSYPGRLIAGTGLEGDRLGYQAPKPCHIEDPSQFVTKARGPRSQEDRVLKLLAEECSTKRWGHLIRGARLQDRDLRRPLEPGVAGPAPGAHSGFGERPWRRHMPAANLPDS